MFILWPDNLTPGNLSQGIIVQEKKEKGHVHEDVHYSLM